MTYVITEPCIGVKDGSCVDVCPVDCIHTTDDDTMFFIDPDECIDCGACEPACPWQAIFEESQVPEVFGADTPLNYQIMQHMDDFEVCPHEEKKKPTVEEVEANKKKWGYNP
jgi:NAD-dependent dihydropyrimidine dehydrogenase PreA subunit